MLNEIEAVIQKLIANAALVMAKDIANAVRQSVVEELLGPSPAGRPTGSGKKAAPSDHLAKPARRPSKRTPITQAELDAILGVIAKQPGMGSKAVQAAAGVDKKQAVRVLAKLRLTKAVKVTGEKSKAVYSVG